MAQLPDYTALRTMQANLQHTALNKRTIDMVTAPATSPVPPKRPNLGSSGSSAAPRTSFTLTLEDMTAMGLKVTERIGQREIYMVQCNDKHKHIDHSINAMDGLVERARPFSPPPQTLLTAKKTARDVLLSLHAANARGYALHIVAIEREAARMRTQNGLFHNDTVSTFVKNIQASMNQLTAFQQDQSELVAAANTYMNELVLYFASFGWTLVVASTTE